MPFPYTPFKKISESDFHQFLRRSGIESALGRDTTSSLIERFDPRGTGYIPYAKFLEKVRTKVCVGGGGVEL